MAQARSVEVADIFRQYGSSYRERHKMPLSQLRSMRAIERCRTAELGGHVDECDCCGHTRISYLALRNKSVFYNILFRSVAETLIELARDPKHLGGEIGFISILHTWGENLMDHPHIHCIVTGGGLSLDGKRWLSCRKTFFISVKVLSRLFRGKVLDYLRESWEQEQLEFQGTIADLQDPAQFSAFLKSLYCREWVVYSKPPFKDPEMLLDYLGRYTHRIAIGNHRILKMQNDEVFFLWRDYADGNKNKTMTVEASEFIRRFLLHVLPERFVKIRYYGLLANRNSKTMLAQCRKLLGAVTEKADAKNMRGTWQEFLLKVCGIDLRQCPFCQEGRMIRKEIVLPVRCNSPPWEKRTW